MPLPADETVVQTSKDILETFHGIFGPHPGFRPAHAKGLLLKGTFTPTARAASLSRAPHFAAPTPVLARFSSSTGFPHIPDTDGGGNPRGLAVRFQLPDDAESGRRRHTDIVAHGIDGFPARDGAGALAFFRALAAGTIGQFLAENPAAAAFVAAPKPTPDGFGRGAYYAVSAFRLVDAGGKATTVRYRFLPAAGERYLSDEEQAKSADRGEDFLFDAAREEVRSGKQPVVFRLVAQVAAEGDAADDATARWPETRELVELGQVVLDEVAPDGDAAQKRLIFDPIPRVDGIEPSADPLLDVRAALYLLSGQERRAA